MSQLEMHDGSYRSAKLRQFQVKGCPAFVIEPLGLMDSERHWLWFSPGWLPVARNTKHAYPRDALNAEHQFYVESALAEGFHIAGVITGPTLGSPAGVEVYHQFYEMVVAEHDLNRRARLVAQSNGGLMHYAWAFRHSECVDRILGIYPATDLRSWPGLKKACDRDNLSPPRLGKKADELISHISALHSRETLTPPLLGYNMTVAELEAQLGQFNPIDNLAPLAAHGVKILHVHGDLDRVVPFEPNSGQFRRRYQALGGAVELEVHKGADHVPGPNFYRSQRALAFLIANETGAENPKHTESENQEQGKKDALFKRDEST